jgi:hypothetical protein
LSILRRCPLVPGGALKVLVDKPDSEGGTWFELLGGAIVSIRGVQQSLAVSLTSLVGVNAGTSAGGRAAQLLRTNALTASPPSAVTSQRKRLPAKTIVVAGDRQTLSLVTDRTSRRTEPSSILWSRQLA